LTQTIYWCSEMGLEVFCLYKDHYEATLFQSTWNYADSYFFLFFQHCVEKTGELKNQIKISIWFWSLSFAFTFTLLVVVVIALFYVRFVRIVNDHFKCQDKIGRDLPIFAWQKLFLCGLFSILRCTSWVLPIIQLPGRDIKINKTKNPHEN